MEHNPYQSPAHVSKRHNNESTKRWNGWCVVLLAVAGLLLLYVLSVGPAAWLGEHGILSRDMRDMVEVIYIPLVFLAMQSETTHELLLDYINLWIR